MPRRLPEAVAQRLCDDAYAAKVALEQARQQYEEALKAAADAGVSNVRVAKRLGVSETAVRLYLRRREVEPGVWK